MYSRICSYNLYLPADCLPDVTEKAKRNIKIIKLLNLYTITIRKKKSGRGCICGMWRQIPDRIFLVRRRIRHCQNLLLQYMKKVQKTVTVYFAYDIIFDKEAANL